MGSERKRICKMTGFSPTNEGHPEGDKTLLQGVQQRGFSPFPEQRAGSEAGGKDSRKVGLDVEES